eukprot:jgi/Mesen1/635/ME000108S_10800
MSAPRRQYSGRLPEEARLLGGSAGKVGVETASSSAAGGLPASGFTRVEAQESQLAAFILGDSEGSSKPDMEDDFFTKYETLQQRGPQAVQTGHPSDRAERPAVRREVPWNTPPVARQDGPGAVSARTDSACAGKMEGEPEGGLAGATKAGERHTAPGGWPGRGLAAAGRSRSVDGGQASALPQVKPPLDAACSSRSSSLDPPKAAPRGSLRKLHSTGVTSAEVVRKLKKASRFLSPEASRLARSASSTPVGSPHASPPRARMPPRVPTAASSAAVLPAAQDWPVERGKEPPSLPPLPLPRHPSSGPSLPQTSKPPSRPPSRPSSPPPQERPGGGPKAQKQKKKRSASLADADFSAYLTQLESLASQQQQQQQHEEGGSSSSSHSQSCSRRASPLEAAAAGGGSSGSSSSHAHSSTCLFAGLASAAAPPGGRGGQLAPMKRTSSFTPGTKLSYMRGGGVGGGWGDSTPEENWEQGGFSSSSSWQQQQQQQRPSWVKAPLMSLQSVPSPSAGSSLSPAPPPPLPMRRIHSFTNSTGGMHPLSLEARADEQVPAPGTWGRLERRQSGSASDLRLAAGADVAGSYSHTSTPQTSPRGSKHLPLSAFAAGGGADLSGGLGRSNPPRGRTRGLRGRLGVCLGSVPPLFAAFGLFLVGMVMLDVAYVAELSSEAHLSPSRLPHFYRGGPHVDGKWGGASAVPLEGQSEPEVEGLWDEAHSGAHAWRPCSHTRPPSHKPVPLTACRPPLRVKARSSLRQPRVVRVVVVVIAQHPHGHEPLDSPRLRPSPLARTRAHPSLPRLSASALASAAAADASASASALANGAPGVQRGGHRAPPERHAGGPLLPLQQRLSRRQNSQFGDLFDVDHFISYLAEDVRVVRTLPPALQSLDFAAIGSQITDAELAKDATLRTYLHAKPILRKNRVVHFYGFVNRLASDPIPFELQRLRCRCNFHALRFVPKLTSMAALLVERMRERHERWGDFDEEDEGEEEEKEMAPQARPHAGSERDRPGGENGGGLDGGQGAEKSEKHKQVGEAEEGHGVRVEGGGSREGVWGGRPASVRAPEDSASLAELQRFLRSRDGDGNGLLAESAGALQEEEQEDEKEEDEVLASGSGTGHKGSAGESVQMVPSVVSVHSATTIDALTLDPASRAKRHRHLTGVNSTAGTAAAGTLGAGPGAAGGGMAAAADELAALGEELEQDAVRIQGHRDAIRRRKPWRSGVLPTFVAAAEGAGAGAGAGAWSREEGEAEEEKERQQQQQLGQQQPGKQRQQRQKMKNQGASRVGKGVSQSKGGPKGAASQSDGRGQKQSSRVAEVVRRARLAKNVTGSGTLQQQSRVGLAGEGEEGGSSGQSERTRLEEDAAALEAGRIKGSGGKGRGQLAAARRRSIGNRGSSGNGGGNGSGVDVQQGEKEAGWRGALADRGDEQQQQQQQEEEGAGLRAGLGNHERQGGTGGVGARGAGVGGAAGRAGAGGGAGAEGDAGIKEEGEEQEPEQEEEEVQQELQQEGEH